jgi:hypothetical protein
MMMQRTAWQAQTSCAQAYEQVNVCGCPHLGVIEMHRVVNVTRVDAAAVRGALESQ